MNVFFLHFSEIGALRMFIFELLRKWFILNLLQRPHCNISKLFVDFWIFDKLKWWFFFKNNSLISFHTLQIAYHAGSLFNCIIIKQYKLRQQWRSTTKLANYDLASVGSTYKTEWMMRFFISVSIFVTTSFCKKCF